MRRQIVTLSLDSSIVDTVDRKRGWIPRSRFIESAIEESLRDRN